MDALKYADRMSKTSMAHFSPIIQLMAARPRYSTDLMRRGRHEPTGEPSSLRVNLFEVRIYQANQSTARLIQNSAGAE